MILVGHGEVLGEVGWLTGDAAVPEMGQLVRVRDQWWTVTDVRPEPRSVTSSTHTVSLLSVEDDGFGQESTVLWEIEPGRRVEPEPRLPVPEVGAFDDPARLDAFLHAVRWGAITSADAEAVQSPFRAGIRIEDYQLAPLVRALAAPRANLLIADDVGLGKTIEAGLVAQELILRHRARTVLVVCPPSLCQKWQAEMLKRFGLDFRIVNSATVKKLRRERGSQVNPFTHFPRLIVSVDWLKLDDQVAVLSQVLPPDPNTYPRRFDLLIVDEIHTCAPAATKSRGYAVDSLRTRLIRRLVQHFEHRLFLSATPHNGYDESFQGLLELLDPLRFAKGVDPKPATLSSVMIRRLKSEIAEELGPREDGSPRFPRREVSAIAFEYPEGEAKVHAALRRYRTLNTGKGASPATRASHYLILLLKKRLLSSPPAFRNTLEKHYQMMLGRAKGAAVVDQKRLDEAFARIDDDHGEDDELEEATDQALLVAAKTLGGLEKLEGEAGKALESMRAWASENGDKPDAKTRRLVEWLDEVCRPDGEWNEERVVVFTEYQDTLHFLERLLLERKVPAERIELIYGGMDDEERERIIAEFQYDPSIKPVRILLATDAASEGIDLQNFCRRMVHVEIPFSPTRLEQRNGRIDRYGQRSATVNIHHFVGRVPKPTDTDEEAGVAVAEADSDFLDRVVEKWNRVRGALGSANPVIERQVVEAILGDRSSFDEEAVDRAATRAPERLKKLEMDLEAEVAKLRARLDESARELEISPEAIEGVVEVGMELGRQQPLVEAADDPALRIVPDLDGHWGSTIVDLVDPVLGCRRPVTFDASAAEGRMDVVHLHLGHPLVTASMRLLRAQVWSNTMGGDLSRVTVRRGDVEYLNVISHGRIVITGRDQRLHEQLIETGGVVRSGRYRRHANLGETAGVLAGLADETVSGVEEHLVELWPQIEKAAEDSLTRRSDEVASQKRAALERRRDKEIADEKAMGEELVASIERRLEDLKKPTYIQQSFEGLDDEERQQFELDVESLERRIAEIPVEIDRHREVLVARYEATDTRVFPVALTFVVPDGWDGSR